MLNDYIHFLRVAYLTLWDKNTRLPFSSRAPANFAGRTVFACLCFQFAAPALVAIALTGGIRGLSRNVVLASFLVPAALVLVWEAKYVERSDTLREIWAKLQAESAAAQTRRKRAVTLFVWGSFAAWLLGFGALITRAILDHRASLGHG